MLCETCIRIGSIDDLFGSLLDFKDRLAVAEKTQAVHKPMPALNRRIPHHKNWAALTSAAAEGCELCQLIFRHRPNSCSQDVQLYATLEGSIEHDLANGGSVCFSIEEPEEQNPTDFDLFVLADDPAATDGLVRGKPIISGDYLDCLRDTALIWLQECTQNHKRCSKATESKLPTRVIDVGSIEGSVSPSLVITMGKPGRWVALSHCWGGDIPSSTTMDNFDSRLMSFPMEKLPRNFQDAIAVTRAFGYRYLWIDSLCIIQNSPGNMDWATESLLMNHVYENADLTIVADSAGTSQDGFLIRYADITSVPIPYESIRLNTQGTIFIRPFLDPKPAGPLQQRAWTLQEETLSRRCLYFTKNCLVWVCLESFKSEKDFHPWESQKGLIQQVFTKNFHSTSPMKIEDFKLEPGDTMGEWYTLVSEYCNRSITFGRDRFPAIAALAQLVHRKTGLSYKAGLWLEDMHRGLLWEARSPRIRCYQEWQAPSWSWASQNFTGCTEQSRPYIQVLWKRFPCEDYEMAEIIECNVKTLHDNPYGQVISAALKICGLTQRANYWKTEPVLLASDDEMVADYKTGTIAPGVIRNNAQHSDKIACIIDDLWDWGDSWDGDLSHWVQQTGFQSRVIYIQVAKFKSTPDGLGVLYALILEPMKTSHEYRRRGIAVLTETLKGMKARVGWAKKTVTIV